MNCTKHFLKRWVERIVGITTEREADEYITLNKDMISEHANKTFEFAEFLYKGQIGDNVTRNYYIKDDLVYVTNVTDDAFITIYKVDMGLTHELNVTVRKGLIAEVKRLIEEKENIEFKFLVEVENKTHEIESYGENIKILEEQLANVKKQKEFAEEEVKNFKSKSVNTGLELRKFTLMLVNSKEYKKDLTTMK